MHQKFVLDCAAPTRFSRNGITYDQLLEDLSQRLSQPVSGKDHDFLPLLQECSALYEVDVDFLLQRGFRRAYRQIIEGL